MVLSEQEGYDGPISFNPASRVKYLPPSGFSDTQKGIGMFLVYL